VIFRMSASLRKALLTTQKLESVAAINWGLVHEIVAINTYNNFGATTATGV
jgi:hypothetical protein